MSDCFLLLWHKDFVATYKIIEPSVTVKTSYSKPPAASQKHLDLYSVTKPTSVDTKKDKELGSGWFSQGHRDKCCFPGVFTPSSYV